MLPSRAQRAGIAQIFLPDVQRVCASQLVLFRISVTCLDATCTRHDVQLHLGLISEATRKQQITNYKLSIKCSDALSIKACRD